MGNLFPLCGKNLHISISCVEIKQGEKNLGYLNWPVGF